jgi:predicted nucleic acid-binding protein
MDHLSITKNSTVFLDTNSLLSFFQGKSDFIKTVIKRIETGEIEGGISGISLFHLFQKGFKRSEAIVNMMYDFFEEMPNLKKWGTDDQTELMKLAAKVSSDLQIEFHDSIMLATAVHYSCDQFVTPKDTWDENTFYRIYEYMQKLKPAIKFVRFDS